MSLRQTKVREGVFFHHLCEGLVPHSLSMQPAGQVIKHTSESLLVKGGKEQSWQLNKGESQA